MVLLVMLEVVLVIGQPTYPSKNIICVEAGIMRGFRHLSMSAQHPPKALFSIRDSPVADSEGSLFVAAASDGKSCVSINPNRLTPR